MTSPASLPQPIYRALQRARFAPSAHNAQPWFLTWNGQELTVGLHPSRKLDDPSGRQNILSVGAFVEYLRISLAAEGLDTQMDTWSPGTAETRLATLRFSDGADPELVELADALQTRRTVHGAYQALVPDGLVERLRLVAHPYLPQLSILTDRAAVQRVAGLVGIGTQAALSLPSMRRELAELVHWSDDSQPTGMTIESMIPGRHRSVNETAASVILEMDAQAVAGHFRDWYACAPVLLVLSTAIDGPEAWLESGRLATRLMLEGAQAGMAHCISAAPIELPHLVPLLRAEVEDHGRPQFLMSLGIPFSLDLPPKSGRLSVDELFDSSVQPHMPPALAAL